MYVIQYCIITHNVEEEKVKCTPPESTEEVDSETKWNVEDNKGHETGSERTLHMDPKKENDYGKQTDCLHVSIYLVIQAKNVKLQEAKHRQKIIVMVFMVNQKQLMDRWCYQLFLHKSSLWVSQIL